MSVKREPFFTSKNIAYLSFLSAVTIVLQIFGNLINFGFATINLSLVPIAIGALTLGPIGGLLLGLLNGFVVLFSADTIAIFYPLTVPGTIVTCLLKCSAAGFCAGLIFKLFKGRKKEFLGSILACISIPIINTLLFSVCFLLFFQDMAKNNGSDNAFSFLILSVIGINFIFELLVNSFLSHVIYMIYRYFDKKRSMREIASKEEDGGQDNE